MKKSQIALAILGGAVILVIAALVAFLAGRGCQPVPKPIVTGIDAGPGERVIDARLDAAVREAERRIAEIEREHADAIRDFDDAQRRKYEHVREQGPEAVVAWVNDFLRARKDGGL